LQAAGASGGKLQQDGVVAEEAVALPGDVHAAVAGHRHGLSAFIDRPAPGPLPDQRSARAELQQKRIVEAGAEAPRGPSDVHATAVTRHRDALARTRDARAAFA